MPVFKVTVTRPVAPSHTIPAGIKADTPMAAARLATTLPSIRTFFGDKPFSPDSLYTVTGPDSQDVFKGSDLAPEPTTQAFGPVFRGPYLAPEPTATPFPWPDLSQPTSPVEKPPVGPDIDPVFKAVFDSFVQSLRPLTPEEATARAQAQAQAQTPVPDPMTALEDHIRDLSVALGQAREFIVYGTVNGVSVSRDAFLTEMEKALW